MLGNWLDQSEDAKVLLVFSAQWSGSTHILYTYVKKIAKSIPHLKYHLIDIEEQPELAAHFGISNVPVSVVIENREVTDYITGTLSKKKLEERLK